MLSTREFQSYYQHLNPEFINILLEVRGLVFEIAPSAAEKLYPKGMTYYHAQIGGPVSAGICGTSIFPDHIRLTFNHGAFLSCAARLEGHGVAKRFLRIASFSTAPWDVIRGMIAESSRFDPYTLVSKINPRRADNNSGK